MWGVREGKGVGCEGWARVWDVREDKDVGVREGKDMGCEGGQGCEGRTRMWGVRGG